MPRPMGNDKVSHVHDTIPIPTYDEATSSRPPSSQAFLGSTEVSDDAERQGLLETRPSESNGGNYRPPTVESARSSWESESSNIDSERRSVEGLRREIMQMDILEPDAHRMHSQPGSLSKRISTFKHSLSSIKFSFRQWLPSFDYIKAHLPRIPSVVNLWGAFAGRFIALFLVLSLVYIVFVSNIFTFRRRGNMGQRYDPEEVRIFVQGHINETSIRQSLEYLTLFDHVAGTEGSFVLAKWVEDSFKVAGLETVALERFDVYLNYPKKGGTKVAIVDPPEQAWEAQIEESMAYKDPPREQTLVFHGLSKTGDVVGPLVYANFGSREDFKRLEDSGINVNGSIALIRYHGTQGDRALKVKAAELAGAVGCIIYSDPNEDGFKKGPTYPDGRFRPNDSVQRGSVGLTSWVVGDVLSPGFASLPGETKRMSKANNPGLNNIPSIPLAWKDAQKLLQSLKGHGTDLSNDAEWKGAVPDVEWFTGDQTSPVVQLVNDQDEVDRQPIYNVLGKILGTEQPDKSVTVGNHRDAWCFGAVDPGSGTAVFVEIVRIFGELKKMGWRPLRTIEFASWDAEEYNLVGSTEHVESRIDNLRNNGLAYINVDVAVQGDKFEAAASPLLEKSLLHVLSRTTDPRSNQTLRSIWEESGEKLKGLGAGSDYVAFQDIAGTSSIDLSFKGPEFPYHSCYDNFNWMIHFGDPDFQYHKVMGQVWALLILELADRPLLPFDLEAYAAAVQDYVRDLGEYADTKKRPETSFDLAPLHKAANLFSVNAVIFHEWGREWTRHVYGMSEMESNVLAITRMNHNTKMANFETDLLDLDGGVSWSISFRTLALHIGRLTHSLLTASGPRAIQTRHLCSTGVVGLRCGIFSWCS